MAKENWPDWPIYVRDGCRCVYCGLDGTREFVVWQQFTIDHLIPRSRNGTNGDNNKVVACPSCNLMKGSYDPRGYEPGAPTFNEPPNDEERTRLLDEARKYIKRNQRDLEGDFRLMLGEIADRKAAGRAANQDITNDRAVLPSS